jgi:hypothetical protein
LSRCVPSGLLWPPSSLFELKVNYFNLLMENRPISQHERLASRVAESARFSVTESEGGLSWEEEMGVPLTLDTAVGVEVAQPCLVGP